MQSLLKDVDADGHLTKPARWGLHAAPKTSGDTTAPTQAEASAGRNKGTVSAELAFWEEIKNGN
eukprot:9491237-Pyramimonas_sp.AAC.1